MGDIGHKYIYDDSKAYKHFATNSVFVKPPQVSLHFSLPKKTDMSYYTPFMYTFPVKQGDGSSVHFIKQSETGNREK